MQAVQRLIKMVADILLQIALILVMAVMFMAMHNIPQRFFAKLRLRFRSDVESKRHFVKGAQLLARARSAPSRSLATSLAEEAVTESDKAIALDPKDAAAHILKALALDIQGFKTSALESLDTALSPFAAKSLSDEERGDALLKRAELKISTNRRALVDSALADLTESVTLSRNANANAYCWLGKCYEMKKLRGEAKKAYEEALIIEPRLSKAQEALERLSSSSSS